MTKLSSTPAGAVVGEDGVQVVGERFEQRLKERDRGRTVSLVVQWTKANYWCRKRCRSEVRFGRNP